MTDIPDGTGQVPRRSPRVSDGGAPVSGALAIVLAVVAVVAGFLILRSISDSGTSNADFPATGSGASDSGAGDDGVTAATTVPPGAVATLPPTTTIPPIVTQGATVLVANANGVSGSAGAMTRELSGGAGFIVADPVNSSATIGDIDDSVIYYVAGDAAAQAVADSVGRTLGGVSSIAPMPSTPPTRDGTLGDATVLLMLGNDKAGKTLDDLAPVDAAAPGNVVTVTNPAVSGTTPPTTTG